MSVPDDVIGSVRFPFGGEELVAVLGRDDKWRVDDDDIADILNQSFPPTRYDEGPSSGGWGALAVNAVAEFLKGTAEFSPVPQDTEERIY